MKPLQNYIEELDNELDEQFLVNPKSKLIHLTGDEKRELLVFFNQSLHRIAKIEIDKIIELVKSKSKGSFTDDWGVDCWYIDMLIKEISKLK